ncbi:cysteine-rich protein, partial [Aphelenchoides avenae]
MKLRVILMLFAIFDLTGGVLAYGICQAGCAGLAAACYSAAGYVFGTVTVGAGTPAAILTCNKAFGVCSAKCALIALAP